jgi:hypothetical protein
VHRLGENRAKPRHHHQLDLRCNQRLGHQRAIGGTVKARPELSSFDELTGNPVIGRDIERSAHPIRDHEFNVNASIEDRVEKGSTSRREYRNTHWF